MSTLNGGPGNIVTNGLVLYLDAANTLSYTSGSTVWNDLSGNNNSGSLVNGPGFSNDNAGSIVFDGVNDYVIHPSLDLGTTCSWGVWINYVRANNSNEFVVLGANQANRYNLFYYFQDKTFYINYGGTFGSFTYNPGLNANTWYNITHVRNNNITTVYLNGVSIGTITINSAITSIFALVGSERTNRYFSNIRLSTVSYYNRALTPTEILQNYNSTKGRFGL
jgi:hypothetical protein